MYIEIKPLILLYVFRCTYIKGNFVKVCPAQNYLPKYCFKLFRFGIPKSFSMSFFPSPMAFFSALTSSLSQIQFSFSIEFSSLFITNSISPHSQRWFYIRTVVSITISNVSQCIGLLGELGQQQMFTGFQKKKFVFIG
jgi:hypothetical protein